MHTLACTCTYSLSVDPACSSKMEPRFSPDGSESASVTWPSVCLRVCVCEQSGIKLGFQLRVCISVFFPRQQIKSVCASDWMMAQSSIWARGFYWWCQTSICGWTNHCQPGYLTKTRSSTNPNVLLQPLSGTQDEQPVQERRTCVCVFVYYM